MTSRRSFFKLITAAVGAISLPALADVKLQRIFNDDPLTYVGRPLDPVTGDYYYDVNMQCVYVYDGQRWIHMGTDESRQK